MSRQLQLEKNEAKQDKKHKRFSELRFCSYHITQRNKAEREPGIVSGQTMSIALKTVFAPEQKSSAPLLKGYNFCNAAEHLHMLTLYWTSSCTAVSLSDTA